MKRFGSSIFFLVVLFHFDHSRFIGFDGKLKCVVILFLVVINFIRDLDMMIFLIVTVDFL